MTRLPLYLSLGLMLPVPALAIEGPFPLPPIIASSKPVEAKECGDIPDTVVRLKTVSKYRQDDPTRSKIDKKAQAEFKKQIAPINDYAERIVKFGNKYLVAQGKKPNPAACGLEWLDAWAKEGGLTRLENDKAYDTQGKTLATLSLGYLEFRNQPGLDPAKKARVETWLATLGDNLEDYVNGANGRSSYNNHRYWSGLGVGAAGAASGRQDLYTWGLESARIGLRQVAADGTLPLELERHQRARDYHMYAVAPLVMIAEMAARNGTDLYAENDGALKRLAALCLRTIDDPTFFEEKTGKKQVGYEDGSISPARLAWLEPYHARFPSAETAKLLAQFRPVGSTGLGGNLTTIYNGR